MGEEAECGHSLFAWEHTLVIPERALKVGRSVRFDVTG